MSNTYQFKWAPGAQQKLLSTPDKIMYAFARLTLDRTYQHIPLSNKVNSGRLRTSSMAYGVKGSNGEYSIGSRTSYAKYVWNMGSGTNWSTPGTYGKWYEKTCKELKKNLLSVAVKQNELK